MVPTSHPSDTEPILAGMPPTHEQALELIRAMSPLIALRLEVQQATNREPSAVLLPPDLWPDVTAIYGTPVVRADGAQPGVVFSP